MMDKRVIPCIFIDAGKAVRWLGDKTALADDVVSLARYYSENGADGLLVFDLSETDADHEESILLMKKINRAIRIPMTAGGNIRRLEDVKKILYAGAKRAVINLSKENSLAMMEEAALRFGKEKIAVSLNDTGALLKHRQEINDNCAELVLMHRLDMDSVEKLTGLPCVAVTDAMDEPELFDILRCPGVRGLSGKYVSQKDMRLYDFKERCGNEGIPMTSFVSGMEFSEFKRNSDGLIPVIAQHYKTKEVLMMAYMDEEAFYNTMKTGKMTYYSRSRNCQWVKGETSGHYQYVRSLTIDCDKDTLLAKVDQVGAACHTGNDTCFFQPLAGTDFDGMDPLQVFESVYRVIEDRKEHPKEGSYTNYLFDKGIDKILKKVGEEATELIIAAKNPNSEEITYEMADFLYHAMVLMVEREVSWEDVVRELADR